MPDPEPPHRPPTLLFLVTEDWFFLSHFAERAVAAKRAGFDVVVAARDRGRGDDIRRLGLRFEPVLFRRRGFNPFREGATIAAIRRLYRGVRPDIVHHVALKPILYGTLAAGRAQVVNAPVGMGFVFTSSSLKAKLLRPLVSLLMRRLLDPRRGRVVFENRDDMAALVADGTVAAARAVLIPGAGVDTDAFRPRPEPEGVVRVGLAARMLRDKGVVEFVDAARQLRARGAAVQCVLIGSPDPENPSSIAEDELRRWHEEGLVAWEGHRTDMPAALAGCHIIALPSYREGLPKVLLEAMASGRPIIATDVPGCREAVVSGENGLLVPVRDAAALAATIEMLAADAGLRRRMGARGRELAETRYSSSIITAQTVALYNRLVGREPGLSDTRPGVGAT